MQPPFDGPATNTVRRRQRTALIWVSLEVLPELAAQGAIRGNITRAVDGSVWVAVYATRFHRVSLVLVVVQGSHPVLSSFAVGLPRN